MIRARTVDVLWVVLSVVVALLASVSWVFGQSGSTAITDGVTVTASTTIIGALSKGSGTFVIDHPLDPDNRLLFHSFVESPDVKNLYDGVVVLNEKGEAQVSLPHYFLALNRDFRYLATPHGQPMPNVYIKKEVKRRWFSSGKIVFTIAGGAPNGKVSWQITGIRHDPYIEANPIINEVEKGEGALLDKGECLFEPLCE